VFRHSVEAVNNRDLINLVSFVFLACAEPTPYPQYPPVDDVPFRGRVDKLSPSEVISKTYSF
jgi:hypothetical protein